VPRCLPRYILRFDDVCPTANWPVLDRVEALLDRSAVRPLVAVVPDNKDPQLVRGEALPDFWQRVREWQAKGWTIGLHGYQHLALSSDRGLIGLWPRSEFAGLPIAEQRERLRAAVDIFEREGVKPTVWVAPWHSFDERTLEIVGEAGITVVSDGFHRLPGKDHRGLLWVPQQLWGWRWRPRGVWTICLHINGWTDVEVGRFARGLRKYQHLLTSLPEICAHYDRRSLSAFDFVFSLACRWTLRSRLGLRRWRDSGILLRSQ